VPREHYGSFNRSTTGAHGNTISTREPPDNTAGASTGALRGPAGAPRELQQRHGGHKSSAGSPRRCNGSFSESTAAAPREHHGSPREHRKHPGAPRERYGSFSGNTARPRGGTTGASTTPRGPTGAPREHRRAIHSQKRTLSARTFFGFWTKICWTFSLIGPIRNAKVRYIRKNGP